MGVEGCEGEAHDVVVAAVDAGDANHADPFLDAVGSGFVEGTVGVDIMDDFVVGQFAEIDIGTFGEVNGAFGGAEAYAGVDGVVAAGEGVEHVESLLA